LERNRISHEGFFLFSVGIEIELFAGWIPIVEVNVAGIGIPLFLRKGAYERFVIQQSEQSLRILYSRPFDTCIRPGRVSDFVNSRVFQNLHKGRAGKQDVLVVLRVRMRDCEGNVPD
jgi:hypothetical protein